MTRTTLILRILTITSLFSVTIPLISSILIARQSAQIIEIATIKFQKPILMLAMSESGEKISAVTWLRNSEPVYGPSRLSTDLMTAKEDNRFVPVLECSFPGRQLSFLSVSHDGNWFSHAIDQHTIRVSTIDDTGDGFFVHGEELTASAISPSSQTLLYVDRHRSKMSDTSQLRLANSTSQGQNSEASIPEHIDFVAWSPSNRFFALNSGQSEIQVWQTSELGVIGIFARIGELENPVVRRKNLKNRCLCFSSDEKLLCAAGENGFAVWEIKTKKLIAKFEDPSCRISGMRFIGDTSELCAFEHKLEKNGVEYTEILEKQTWSRWVFFNGEV